MGKDLIDKGQEWQKIQGRRNRDRPCEKHRDEDGAQPLKSCPQADERYDAILAEGYLEEGGLYSSREATKVLTESDTRQEKERRKNTTKKG